MKNKIYTVFLLLLCTCFFATSCGAEISALDNLLFSVRDFDLAKAEKYVSDADGYFAGVRELEGLLTAEQKGIAKEIYSYVSFSEAVEENGTCTLTLKYVDVAELIKSANETLAAGTGSASDYLRDMLEGGTLKNLFLKTEKNVTVVLSEIDGKAAVALGYAGENADLTRFLGLDTFLRWYSLQS